MYSIRIKNLTEKALLKGDRSDELQKRLKLRRERLQSRSKKRTQDWIEGVDVYQAKEIMEGAMRRSMSPK
jgi:hypothetical protein